jgi:hypothetical protein
MFGLAQAEDPDPGQDEDTRVCRATFAQSLGRAAAHDDPFPHWVLTCTLPSAIARSLMRLPISYPDLGGISGARELHNNSRRYFDAEAQAAFPVCGAVARAFQADETVAAIEETTGARLDGCYLRIEYAQDTDGFWLNPHTDLGVKTFTLLYYLESGGGPDMGTDLYRDAATWAKRVDFATGRALAFVPSDRTWHGFEPRSIRGVRKSLILNYVTEAWRSREQLSFPRAPVRGRGRP